MDWFTLSLIGMVLYGIQNFIYKVVAEKNLNTGRVLMTSFVAGAILSGILLLFNFTPGQSYTGVLVFAAFQASFYLISRYVKIESFKYIPTVVALPVSRIHFALTALLGIYILGEPYTASTTLGLALFLAVILMLSNNISSKDAPSSNYRAGIALAIATAIFTTISEFMVKLAAVIYDPLIFMFLSYTSLIIPSLMLSNRLNSAQDNKKQAAIAGATIGLFNFASFFTVINALKTGPASVVFPVIGLNMLVTVFLAVIIYKEKLTHRRIAAIILSVAAIALLRQ